MDTAKRKNFNHNGGQLGADIFKPSTTYSSTISITAAITADTNKPNL